jgi:hypothetical protein
MIYLLIFHVCSILTDGASCHDLAPIPLQQGVGAIGCLIASQVEGAKWIAGHPNSYVGRATCTPARNDEAKL